MSIDFLTRKIIPLIAVVVIYAIGTLNLNNMIFLPIALTIAGVVFFIANRYSSDNKED